LKAWLVRTSGRLAGTRYPIRGSVTRVGRGPQNDILIEDDAGVSLSHFEIHTNGEQHQIVDADSTNGIYVNGVRTEQAILEAPCAIQLGLNGPQLAFVLDDSIPVDPDHTLKMSGSAEPVGLGEHEGLLAEALVRVRLTRGRITRDHTREILHEAIHKAVTRTRRSARVLITSLVVALVALTAFTIWKVYDVRMEKRAIDARIQEVEALLQKAGLNQEEADVLLERLNRYQTAAQNVSSTLLYRMGGSETVNPVEQELKSLMAEFGAETFRFPPEFLEQVERFVAQYQGPDRSRITSALGSARNDLETMRAIFQRQQLPPDLAYMTIVESAVSKVSNPRTGAAGPWQFMAPTARAFGLVVNEQVDERMDIRKSTLAACKLMRELILDFGAEGSVMLAVAAYNVGPGRVKQAVRKVQDPIKQRNFWYLYRIGALPLETREYVPKVLAVLIIARNPPSFGF
jgi:hypothetical protein